MKPLKWFFAAAVLTALLLLAACTAPTQGPTTWIDRPLDGDQVAQELVTIQAHASDASGVDKFEFYINEALLSSPAASGTRFSQATVEWIPPAPGTYVIRARAVGGSGSPGKDARAFILVGATNTVTQAPLTITPVVTAPPQPLCTPPKCGADEVYFCAGNCPGGCGPGCATRTPSIIEPTALPVEDITPVPPPPIITITPAPVCAGAPVIASFSANPSSITSGQSTTLSWGAVTNATSAWIDPGIGGVGTPGSTRVNPAGTTTYTLTATGCGGTMRRQVTVAVNPAPPPPGITLVPLPLPIITVPTPPADTTAPSISGVSVNPTSVSRSGCGRTTTATVSARVTDAGGVSRVVVRLGGVGGGEYGMGAAGGDAYSATVGPLGSLGQVTIQIVAWDRAGNSSQAGGPTINVICIQ